MIVFFAYQLGVAILYRTMTNYFIRQDVALMREQLIENGVAVTSLSPMISTISSVGTQLSSMVSTQFLVLAWPNTLMFFLLFRIYTKEKKEEQS